MKSSYKVRLNLFFLKYRKSLGIFNYSKNVVLLNYRSERSKGREFYCLNSYADLFNVFRANNSVMAGLEVEKILGGQKKMVQESCERGLIIKNTYLRMRVLGCWFFLSRYAKLRVFNSLDRKRIGKKYVALKSKKKKFRWKKFAKLIRPSRPVYKRFKKCPRNVFILKKMIQWKILVSDGYSYNYIRIKSNYVGCRVGFVWYKTRAISPIKLVDKGKLVLDMSQVSSYKLKREQVKRKKS